MPRQRRATLALATAAAAADGLRARRRLPGPTEKFMTLFHDLEIQILLRGLNFSKTSFRANFLVFLRFRRARTYILWLRGVRTCFLLVRRAKTYVLGFKRNDDEN